MRSVIDMRDGAWTALLGGTAMTAAPVITPAVFTKSGRFSSHRWSLIHAYLAIRRVLCFSQRAERGFAVTRPGPVPADRQWLSAALALADLSLADPPLEQSGEAP